MIQVRAFTVSVYFFSTHTAVLDSSQHKLSIGSAAPATEAIEYETRVFQENFVTKGPYMGRPDGVPDAGIPNDEADALWEGLYSCESLYSS